MRLLFLTLLVLSACYMPKSLQNEDAQDQCLRRELYQQCMDKAPRSTDKDTAFAGTKSWIEISKECDRIASYYSVRSLAHIKPECQP